MADHAYFANLIWQIADLLRGPYRPPQYERVMLPMTVLRRFDCVLAETKGKVLAEHKRRQKSTKLNADALDRLLNRAAEQRFHNHSPLDFQKLKGDPDHIEKHLVSYIEGFSGNVRRIFEFFEFGNEIEKMREANILFLVVSKFADVDLHPDQVPNAEMGLIFENLIRRFNELANETAGDHFTPREVIRMMVSVLFIDDDALLSTPGTVRTLLDPACGTGGMLAEAQNYLREHHSAAKLYVFGQDYNKRAFATAASDMLMKDVDQNGGTDNIRFGDIFTDDKFNESPYDRFDYLLANPPFGVDWKRQKKDIETEHQKRGFGGRFGAGLPRINDGSLLFLQHMISKFEPVLPAEHKHGSRLAIVLSGSPLFTGGAGSGESEIRKWILENDWLEAIIALPEQMFYNTGIGTYVWIVTNRKKRKRKKKVQLIDARELYVPMRRSLGAKRRKLGEPDDGNDQIAEIVRIYGKFREGPKCKIFDTTDFGYTRVTVERPLRLRYQMTLDDKARFLDACPHLLDAVQAIDREIGREPLLDWNVVWRKIEKILRDQTSRWTPAEKKLFRNVFTTTDASAEPVKMVGRTTNYEPDPALRDFEKIPLKVDVDEHFKKEVKPFVPDAWMDREKDRAGYEINFNRYFYIYKPPRAPVEVDVDLKRTEERILQLLEESAKKRQILITQAATQGLDSEVELRDSDVPWIGRIPAHWTTARLKFVADIQGGITLGKKYLSENLVEYPYIRVANVQDGYLNLDEVSTVEIPETEAATCRLQPGDVLMNEGGDADKLGRGCIWRGEIDPCLHQNHVFAVRPRGVTSEWLNIWTSTDSAKAFFESRAKQSTNLASISATNLKELPIPLPPKDEQLRIVRYIESEMKALRLLEQATLQAMEFLSERRGAVIMAAATGQLSIEVVK